MDGQTHHFILTVTTLLTVVSLTSSQQVYHIVPSHSLDVCEQYSHGKCTSLAELAANLNNKSEDNNLTLAFSPGEYSLTQYITIADVNNVTLIGDETQLPLINFEGSSGFIMSNISTLSVVNLNMSRFGQTVLDISTTETIIIENCLIIGGNSKPQQQPNSAVYITDAVSVSVIESHFSSNYIYYQDDNSETLPLPGVRGGVLNIDNAHNVSMEGCSFTDNSLHNTWSVSDIYSGTGAAMYVENITYLAIVDCILRNNTAICYGCIDIRGGVIFSHKIHQFEIISSTFEGNMATDLSDDPYELGSSGGAIYIEGDLTVITGCQFVGNAASWGGSIYIDGGAISISNCSFNSNSAYSGAAVYVEGRSMTSSNNVFTNNYARNSGTIYVDLSRSGSYNSSFNHFTNNTAQLHGGATMVSGTCYLDDVCMTLSSSTYDTYTNNGADIGGAVNVEGTNTQIKMSNFTNNQANERGAAVTCHYGTLTVSDSEFSGNQANGNRVIDISSANFVGRNIIFSNNHGSLCVENSQVELYGNFTFANNNGINGGAITSVLSTIILGSTATVTITWNNATRGGGIYLVVSILKIFFPGSVSFSKNKAVLGGALSLEQNSKIYLFNQELVPTIKKMMTFSGNSAQYGGAVYISDRTATGALCEIDNVIPSKPEELSQTECFLQTVILLLSTNTIITFINNTASIRGNDMYGGLFDRCFWNFYTNNDLNMYTGLDYIKAIATFNYTKGINLSRADLRDSISSDAVQLCYCMDDNTYDCTVMEHQVSVKRGGAFSVRVTAVDQIQYQVDSTVLATFSSNSSVGRFKEEQTKRDIPSACTELEYNVYSDKPQLQTDLYAEGPCGDKGISRRILIVKFLPCDCPIGFQPSESTTECKCECDKKLEGTIANCSIENETIQLSTNAWIGYVNESINNTGFIIYSTCPYDYCRQKPINISLSIPNGADMQCAFNRTNLLCGECEEGLSLVLGTSRCKLCTNGYLSLLALFAILGILLVAFILIINMTVATGTIHGVIFYANIVGATQSIFFSSQESAIIISWLNLDFGIETCFYNGMNSYAKVLLQLAFPSYLIFLTIMIIILCEHSQRFAALLGNKNPVATLSTLILLSYSKLLRMIVAAFQYTYLDYPDGSSEIVWLYNANVPYFQLSHIPRFIIASIIVVLGAVYTILLFFGQWLPRLSNWKVMKWIRRPKYSAFIDAYHAPFSPKHRYWVGLLLFARIVLNLVESLTTEAPVTLLSVGCIGVVLILLKTINTRTYKSWALDTLENSFLVNLTVLSLATYYVRESEGNQLALISTSTSIAFLTFLAIICYHVYKYLLKGTTLWEKLTQAITRRRANLNRAYQLAPMEYDSESDDDNSLVDYVTDPPPNYTGNDSTTSMEEPRFQDQPIIRSALILDQLREPALDILDPVTDDHYREARRRSPAPAPRPVTHTVIDRTSR